MFIDKTAGRIEVIQGCMFAGKTEELIARLRAAMEGGLKTAAFKHAIDERYDPDHIITHTRDKFTAFRVPDGAAIERLIGDASVIGIDEGHFFGLSLVDSVRRLRDRGKRIIIVGLEHDAWGNPFVPMPQLAEIAHSVLSKRIGCTVCGEAAMFTQRMVPVHTPTMVGGVGEYEPRCRAHFQPLEGEPR